MPQTEQWTIGRLLTWTTEYLKKCAAPSARLDAEILLAEARGCQRIDLYTAYDELASDEVRTAFRELVRRRAEGQPVAYLVGKREFYSLSFYVNPDVLIPRPETEFVVIAALDWAKRCENGDRPLDVADVGTGSGVIAVCLAKHLPRCRVTAVDISPAALAVARRNVQQHGVQQRITLVTSDLLGGLPSDQRFDIIASNPPYVREAEFQHLSPDVRNHEPKLALLAGQRGTEVIEPLIHQAGDRLRSGGTLIIEVSPMIAAATRALIDRDDRFRDTVTINDLAGHARVIQTARV